MRVSPKPSRVATACALGLAALALAVSDARAQFAVAGQKVPPAGTNFAGVRQVSPRYGLVVQINYGVRTAGDFDLSLVDDVYASLLREFRREPLVPADLLPLVVITEAKIARFGQGARRRMFRWLEPEIRQHRDLHLSPTAIFISDETLGDGEKLRSVLARGLRFLFDQKFRDALDSMDHPMPDR